MVIDEIDFQDGGGLLEAVIPIFTQRKTALFVSSSMNTHQQSNGLMSHWSQQIDERTGKPIFDTITFESACDECYESGRGVNCPHLQYNVPAHQSDEKRSIINKLYPPDKRDTCFREVANVESMSNMLFFTKEELKHIPGLMPRALPVGRVEVLYVSIDPNGGGQDNMGIAIIGNISTENMGPKVCVCDDTFIVVVAVDTCGCTTRCECTGGFYSGWLAT